MKKFGGGGQAGYNAAARGWVQEGDVPPPACEARTAGVIQPDKVVKSADAVGKILIRTGMRNKIQVYVALSCNLQWCSLSSSLLAEWLMKVSLC